MYSLGRIRVGEHSTSIKTDTVPYVAVSIGSRFGSVQLPSLPWWLYPMLLVSLSSPHLCVISSGGGILMLLAG